MKRRAFVTAVALAPVALAQAPAQIAVAPADAAGDPVLLFFDNARFATFRKLCDLLEPAVYDNSPSALAAGAPEFLDFYLSKCPADRQALYREGLDELERQSQARFRRAFAQTDVTQATELLSPLRQKWTSAPPSRLLEFLRDAREIVRPATRNSIQWERVGRGDSGNYWKPVD